MKSYRILAAAAAVGIFSRAITSIKPRAIPNCTAWTLELMLKAKGVAEVSVSPDGKRVAFSVSVPVVDGEHSEWLSQIYVAAADGRHWVQLTRGEKSATNPAWSPDGQWIAFLTPRAGPKSNVWRIPVDGGEAEQLTDEKGGLTAFQWSPDGSQIAFLMTDPKTDAEEKSEREKRDAFVVNENQKRSRLYIIPVAASGEGKRPVRKLTGGDIHVGGLLGGRNFDFSPDGARIVFTHQPTPQVDDWQKTDLSLVEVATARVTPVVASEAAKDSAEGIPRMKQGSAIAYTAGETPAAVRPRLSRLCREAQRTGSPSPGRNIRPQAGTRWLDENGRHPGCFRGTADD